MGRGERLEHSDREGPPVARILALALVTVMIADAIMRARGRWVTRSAILIFSERPEESAFFLYPVVHETLWRGCLEIGLTYVACSLLEANIGRRATMLLIGVGPMLCAQATYLIAHLTGLMGPVFGASTLALMCATAYISLHADRLIPVPLERQLPPSVALAICGAMAVAVCVRDKNLAEAINFLGAATVGWGYGRILRRADQADGHQVESDFTASATHEPAVTSGQSPAATFAAATISKADSASTEQLLSAFGRILNLGVVRWRKLLGEVSRLVEVVDARQTRVSAEQAPGAIHSVPPMSAEEYWSDVDPRLPLERLRDHRGHS